MSFLRSPNAGAADRETLNSLKWILGQMTVLALVLRRSPAVGLFCPSRFRNGSTECPGSAKQRLAPSLWVRIGSAHSQAALFQRLRFDWRESGIGTKDANRYADLFHRLHFGWAKQQVRRNSPLHRMQQKWARIGIDSLRHGRCEINSFPDTLPDFLEPRSRIGAVNHAPQKA